MFKRVIIAAFFFILFSFLVHAEDAPVAPSKKLTDLAWDSLVKGHFHEVHKYADICITLYSEEAKEMQAGLEDFPSQKEASRYWALNDVATCYFIKAKALLDQNQKDEAEEIFHFITKEFPHAQCWEPKGWFWTVADAAKDHILLIEKNIHFEDYRSSTLTSKSWEACPI